MGVGVILMMKKKRNKPGRQRQLDKSSSPESFTDTRVIVVMEYGIRRYAG